MIEKQEWDALLKQIAEQNERHEKSQRRREEIQRNRWRQWAGSLFDEILQSVEATSRHLENPDSNVRICCADVLVNHWKVPPESEHARRIEQLAFRDADPVVRSVVLFDIAKCYLGTDDVHLGKSMALVVKDSAAATDERRSAYRGLFSLRDLPFGGSFDKMMQQSDNLPRIPEDVDWSFVETFLVEGRQPSPVDPLTRMLSILSPDEREFYQKVQPAKNALEAGDDEEAIPLLSEAIEILPDAPGLFRMRAQALAKLGRLDDAIGDWTQAIALVPFLSTPYYERGLLYQQKGEFKLAKTDFETARDLDKQ
jgi:tetratricopeptide (TPR) repeat protein